jgi:hypothetical protein
MNTAIGIDSSQPPESSRSHGAPEADSIQHGPLQIAADTAIDCDSVREQLSKTPSNLLVITPHACTETSHELLATGEHPTDTTAKPYFTACRSSSIFSSSASHRNLALYDRWCVSARRTLYHQHHPPAPAAVRTCALPAWHGSTTPPLLARRRGLLQRHQSAPAAGGFASFLSESRLDSAYRLRPGPGPLSVLLAITVLDAADLEALGPGRAPPARAGGGGASCRQVIAWLCTEGRAAPPARDAVVLAVMERGAALAARLAEECGSAAALRAENRRLAAALMATLAEGGRARCTPAFGGGGAAWFAGAGGSGDAGAAAQRAFDEAAAAAASVFTWAESRGPRRRPAGDASSEAAAPLSPWRRGGLLLDGEGGLRTVELETGPARLVAGYPAACEVVPECGGRLGRSDGVEASGGGSPVYDGVAEDEEASGAASAPEAARVAWRALHQGGGAMVPWPNLRRWYEVAACGGSSGGSGGGSGGAGGPDCATGDRGPTDLPLPGAPRRSPDLPG